MRARRGGVLALVALALACASTAPPPAQPAAAAPVLEGPPIEPFRVLAPTERVPAFSVTDTAGKRLDSSALIGRRAFVVVFFATWCDVCELKLPEVRRAAAAFADVTTLYVSIDEPASWPAVPAYLERHGLEGSVVRAESFPRFALAYAPLQTVPAVAVIGRNGYLVDYQVGWGRHHGRRLLAACQVARRIPVDAPPFLATP